MQGHQGKRSLRRGIGVWCLDFISGGHIARPVSDRPEHVLERPSVYESQVWPWVEGVSKHVAWDPNSALHSLSAISASTFHIHIGRRARSVFSYYTR